MEMSMLWLVAVALAQSAIAMSMFLLRLQQQSHDPLGPLAGLRPARERRSMSFGGFSEFASESKSWFPWPSSGSGSGSSSNYKSDFSPPDFAAFGGGIKGGSRGGKSGGKGSGRAEASLGPIFITKVDVPESMRNKFNRPAETSTAARRAKYGLDREFSTPPHAYRIAEEIPFFDTLDHKTVMLTLQNFRADNGIPLAHLQSIRPFFPFFVKN
ncbi:uncharacterized protein LOC108669616 [Hyalella azteca]|uniref:Uncharacterized protein LOC108669616 n=1 Tax=Hyalella azteca TaxID=294128 RepID=A0A8B7NFT4_HYAAZ|nr:uncharacterized protein LOC108669616 [Hyalella azteca]